MANAWSTVVTKHSDFDDYTRSRIFALMAWEAGKCPSCGNYDSLVELPADKRHVTWAQHDGTVLEVLQYRCLPCASKELVQRDFAEKHKDDKAAPGNFIEADGRVFIARPANETEGGA